MISRIALLICFLIGITCVTSQGATIQTQLSTNQTVALSYTCNDPYATATDNQGVVYGTCAQNNGSQGILWTYSDSQGNIQQGWVTSPGNSSCSQSYGISVSQNGTYLFATCSGNPMGMQIIGYEKQIVNGTWLWNSFPLNTTLVCGHDIIFDDMTEDLYAICSTTLTSNDQRIIKFSHNQTTDTYITSQDLGIMANYIKYNSFNNYLYYATTTDLGYLVIHNPDNTSISMPNNINNTVIQVNGTLTYWCEITSFTWFHNSSNTLFVGCTGFHDSSISYTSYSILRIDMNQTMMTINQTIPVISSNSTNTNTSSTNSTNTNTTQSTITITQTIMNWTYTAMNISFTDSKLSGADGNNDLSFPADGSCKSPSDMEMDNMNQLYVACMQNAPSRSLIRYTQMNSTYWLPAYVTTSTEICNHPFTNSLTIDNNNNVIIACSATNKGLEFTNNITISSTSSNSNSSSSGSSSSNTTSSTGTFLSTGTTSNPLSTGTGSSGTGPTSTPPSTTGSSGSTSTGTCVGPTCVTTGGSTGTTSIPSSSTGSKNGTINNMSSQVHVDMAGFILAIILLIISM